MKYKYLILLSSLVFVASCSGTVPNSSIDSITSSMESSEVSEDMSESESTEYIPFTVHSYRKGKNQTEYNYFASKTYDFTLGMDISKWLPTNYGMVKVEHGGFFSIQNGYYLDAEFTTKVKASQLIAYDGSFTELYLVEDSYTIERRQEISNGKTFTNFLGETCTVTEDGLLDVYYLGRHYTTDISIYTKIIEGSEMLIEHHMFVDGEEMIYAGSTSSGDDYEINIIFGNGYASDSSTFIRSILYYTIGVPFYIIEKCEGYVANEIESSLTDSEKLMATYYSTINDFSIDYDLE